MASGPNWMHRWVPGVAAARHYDRAWLEADVRAGIILAALLVPQGMAYAQLAGLPPQAGLYTTVAALVAYAAFGPSPVLVLGPDSALAPLIAAAVLPLAAGDPDRAIELAALLALLAGGFGIAAGLARVGAVIELMSKPVRIGYLNGLAVLILVDQLPVLLGIPVDRSGPLDTIVDLLRSLDDTQTAAVAIGVGALAVIGVGRIVSPSFPGVLVAVVGATTASSVFDLSDRLAVVGRLPSGVPAPTVPTPGFQSLADLALPAAAIAVVSLADTSALSTTLARTGGAGQHRGRSDANHEIVGLGAANLACGLLQGFPVSASTTRTVVATSVGSRTQLTGLVGAGLVAAMVAFAGGLLHDMPIALLAAVIITAALGLLDIGALVWMARVHRVDFLLSVAALVGVVLLGVFEGVALAVALSLAAFVWRSWRPHDAVLGRVEGRKGYHDLQRHPLARRVPGLVVFRFDAPVFFANAEHFRRRVLDVLDAEPGPVQWLVLAAEPITDIDTTGAEVLGELIDELDAAGVRLGVAELKGPAKDELRRYGLYDRIGDDAFFSTLGLAIDAYVAATGVTWVDWTDR